MSRDTVPADILQVARQRLTTLADTENQDTAGGYLRKYVQLLEAHNAAFVMRHWDTTNLMTKVFWDNILVHCLEKTHPDAVFSLSFLEGGAFKLLAADDDDEQVYLIDLKATCGRGERLNINNHAPRTVIEPVSARLGHDQIQMTARFGQNGGDVNTPEICMFVGAAYKQAVADEIIANTRRGEVNFDDIQMCAARGISGFVYLDLHRIFGRPHANVLQGFNNLLSQIQTSRMQAPKPYTICAANQLALGASRIAHNEAVFTFLAALRADSIEVVPANVFTELNQTGCFALGGKKWVFSLALCAATDGDRERVRILSAPLIEFRKNESIPVHNDAADVAVTVIEFRSTTVLVLLPMSASAGLAAAATAQRAAGSKMPGRFSVPIRLLESVIEGKSYDGRLGANNLMSPQLFHCLVQGICLPKDVKKTLEVVLGLASPFKPTPGMQKVENTSHLKSYYSRGSVAMTDE